MTTTTEVPGSTCPGCQRLHSYVTGVTGTVPKPLDHTVCCFCGALLTFREDMQLRRTTQAELNALPWADRALLDRLQKKIRASDALRGK